MNKHPSPENMRDAPPVAGAAGDNAPKGRAKAKMRAAKRTCIMVLGMHRSGTSALTRAISLLGAGLPKNSIPADSNNANGYWEPTPLTLLNDQMLIEAGSRWDDWRPFDLDSLSPPRAKFFKSEIARIVGEEYGDEGLIVLKEPRISRFVPLYEAILASMNFQMRYVLTVRNPLSVVASLNKRDGMTSAFGSLLWLRYVLDAEKATRGAARVFLSYESLIADWHPFMARIGETLSIDWPRPPARAEAEIDLFLSAEHQHHVATVEHLLADEAIAEWAKDTYLAVRSFEKDALDQQALDRLDQIRLAFDEGARQFGAACILELNTRQTAFINSLSVLERRNSEKDREIKVLSERGASLRATAEALVQRENAQNQLFIEREKEIGKLAEEAKIHKAQSEALARQLIELEREAALERESLLQRQVQIMAENDEKRKVVDLLSEKLDKIYRSRAWKILTSMSKVFSHFRPQPR